MITLVHSYRKHHRLPPCKCGLGLGDFLRGSLTLCKLSKKYNHNFELDFTNHNLNDCLINTCTGFCKEEYVPEFFWQNWSNLEPYVSSLQGNDFIFLSTNAYCFKEKINNECKNIVKNKLILKPKFQDKLNNYKLGIYCTVHLRMGDEYDFETIGIPDIIKTYLDNVIVPKWGNNILLISDSFKVKQAIKMEYDIKTTDIYPIHTGGGILTLKETSSDYGSTMVEFFLMSMSKEIYRYSPYTWGSGFSDICGIIYDIPVFVISGRMKYSGIMKMKNLTKKIFKKSFK